MSRFRSSDDLKVANSNRKSSHQELNRTTRSSNRRICSLSSSSKDFSSDTSISSPESSRSPSPAKSKSRKRKYRSRSRSSERYKAHKRKRPSGHKTKKKRSPERSEKKKVKKKKKSLDASHESSEDISSGSGDSSSEDDKQQKKNTKRKKNKLHDPKTTHRLKRKKKKKAGRATSIEQTSLIAVGPRSSSATVIAQSRAPKEKSSAADVKPSLAASPQQLRRPMTKEEYERQQSVLKRVFDPDTGRHRLVKGDGEIVEEIVSRERQKAINKQATIGDGLSFMTGLNKFS